jgi:hypothetical protein
MQATALKTGDLDSDNVENAVKRVVDPEREDAYWQRWHRYEHYYRPGLDYEDYAPAYCVGYVGYAQYGGAFDDAEPWLCSNWARIKGDSRLGLDDAVLAMRSAWERLSIRRTSISRLPVVGLIRRRLRIPSFKLNPGPMR